MQCLSCACRRQIGLQLEHILRKRIATAPEIAAQGARGQLIAARSATQSEINPARIKRVQSSKLFRDDERGMVWQHDPTGADPDPFRSAGDMTDHHRRRGAGNSGKVMMFRQPISMITPFLGVAGQIESVAKGQRGVAPFDDGRKIEQGIIFHRLA